MMTTISICLVSVGASDDLGLADLEGLLVVVHYGQGRPGQQINIKAITYKHSWNIIYSLPISQGLTGNDRQGHPVILRTSYL